MTKLEVIEHVQELVQDTSTEMANLIRKWVELVLRDISARCNLKSLEATQTFSLVASTSTYTLSTTPDKVIRVWVPEWGITTGLLTPISEGDYSWRDASDGTAVSTGQPKYYYRPNETQITVWPAPNSTYASDATRDKVHVRYTAEIALLSDATEISEIKNKHIPVIIAGAYVYGARFDALGDLPDAIRQYESGLRRLVADNYLELDRARATIYQGL